MFPKLFKSKLERKETKVNIRINCWFKPDAYVKVLASIIIKKLEKVFRINLEKEYIY